MSPFTTLVRLQNSIAGSPHLHRSALLATILRLFLPPLCHCPDQVVEDLEEADQAEAHAEAQQAAGVGHKSNDGDFLQVGNSPLKTLHVGRG